MALISISIDIAGSTDIKKKIKDFSPNDPDNIIRSYQDILVQLYNLEMNFYCQLVHYGIDLNNVFVIKTIGDEIWVVYDLSKDKIEFQTYEFNDIVTSILNCLLDVNFKHYGITISERSLTIAEEENFELQNGIKFKNISIIPKVYVDILDNYEEANHIRFDIFNKRFPVLLPRHEAKKINLEERKLKFKTYVNNLNFGMASDDGKKVAFRFDPIGFEIDRFFRSSKYTKAGIISVGQSLFDKMIFDRNDTLADDEYYIENLQIPYGNEYIKKYTYYRCISKLIEKAGLKGIGEDYRINYLYIKELLPSKMTAGKDSKTYDETLKLINRYDNIQSN